ncbi:Beta-lactamase [Arthrobotrys entomopaga]|nr:Beta-lactamase [Arthrobotrys entomopaga]
MTVLQGNPKDGYVSCLAENEYLAERFTQTIPLITKIQEAFQIVSISLGVLHKGKVVFTKGFGCADVSTGRVPDGDTIYNIASCTKGFTGSALNLLANDGKLSKSKPISDCIPGFRTPHNPVVGDSALLGDILSHSTGLADLAYTVVGKNQSVFANYEDVVEICANLPRAAPFRSEWRYNNWMFALAGRLVAIASGESYGSYIKREIFDELGLTRTSTTYPQDDNHARPYKVYANGTKDEVHLPDLNDGVAFDGSGSIRSCVNDLLIWCKALIDASNLHSKGFTGKQARLLQAISDMRQPQFPLASDPNQTYGNGVFNFVLPTTEINTITNSDVIKKPWVMGADSPQKAVCGHTGELGGFLCAYMTYPETESAVVVLTTGFAATNGDGSNIIAQLLTQTLFDLQPRINYLDVANDITTNAIGRWDAVRENWLSHRTLKPLKMAHPIDWFVGKYRDAETCISAEITKQDDERFPLSLRVNGREEQTFPLYQYHEDVWTFLPPTRDECIKFGFGGYLYSWEVFNLYFEESQGCPQFAWNLGLDARVPPTIFLKD